MHILIDVISTLVQIVIHLYVLAILIRFLLQVVRADFYNPLSQALVKLTNPALIPLRKVIPGFAGIDTASLVLAFVVLAAGICLIPLLHGAPPPGILKVISWSILGILAIFLRIYFLCLLLVVILSWVAPQSMHPGAVLAHQIVDPLISRVRRIIPPIGVIDLSVFFILIAIFIIKNKVLLAVAALMPLYERVPPEAAGQIYQNLKLLLAL